MNARSASSAVCLRRLATLVGVVVALGATPAGSRAASLGEGAIAPTDLLAPVDLQVTPLVGRDTIATRDGQLLPAVARFDAALADAVEREFNAAFVQARTGYLDALEQAFGARAIDEARIASLRFQSFRSEFVAAHPGFPVGYVLAAAWARGDDGEVVRVRMAGVLRQIMSRQLIGAMPRAATVFVVALPQEQLVRAWSEASPALVRAVDGSAVVTLEAARSELWKSLGVGERFAGGYLETLVRENIRYDARLTALFLHERLGAAALEGRFFGRGEVIVRGGESVDAFAAEALHQFEQLGLAPLMPATAVAAPKDEEPPAPAPVAVAPAPASAPVSAPVAAPAMPAASFEPARLGGWMIAIAALGVVSLGLGAWVCVKLRRLRRTTIAVRPTQPDLREVLAPHLAREMTKQGMQALFTQRQELLETTVVATERVAEMESRVAKVQPAIQERMQSYERRIRALERELQEK